jgi:hypothetical protein
MPAADVGRLTSEIGRHCLLAQTRIAVLLGSARLGRRRKIPNPKPPGGDLSLTKRTGKRSGSPGPTDAATVNNIRGSG